MTTILTMKNTLPASTPFTHSPQSSRRALNTLAVICLLLSLPGLVASLLLLVAALLGRVALGPRDILALMVETALLALTVALYWLDLRQTARDARRRAAYIQTILDHIDDGVLSLDQQGNFLAANPALLNMIPEDHLRQLDAPLEETLRWRRAVFSVATFAVPDIGAVLIFNDETRRHEIERAKESLLATISHELRTPLGAVMNYIELLMMLNQTGKSDSGQFSEHLLRALQNTRRLDHLVNAILDQAQLEAGMVQLNEQTFHLRELLEGILAVVQPLARDKRLAVVLIFAPETPIEMCGDAERLQKVLLNLLDNAIKFTSRGTVKVQVSLSDVQTVVIEVIDSGPGIPHAQLPDVFAPFRRASDYAAREHQGAGLGLSIAKQTIVRMGGRISVSSISGKGTTFTIHLPLKPTARLRRLKGKA